MVIFNVKLKIVDRASRIRLPVCDKLAVHLKNNNDVINNDGRPNVIVTFFDIIEFLFWGLYYLPNFMSMTLPILVLWQFLFISEIGKNLSELCSISGELNKFEIPNLAWLFLMTSCQLVTSLQPTYTVCELRDKTTQPQPRLGLTKNVSSLSRNYYMSGALKVLKSYNQIT